ncbi:MAG: ATP-binding cassette domain-containing protein [Spirochaetaceae bacterium]|nr:ATP-binding cassette domain-containing protein [Spirochaetaceae bacterium]
METPYSHETSNKPDKELKIELSNVSFSYGDYNVLHNISFKVYKNDIITVVGPNGGGKTTLLKLILGLLKQDSGTIKVYSDKRAGYVPQYTFFDMKFPVTVFDVVLAGRINSSPGFYTKLDKIAAEKALDEMKLTGLEKQSFSALSGGQRQRALIARAIACDPDILIMDEPTANVDATIGSYLSDYIINLERKFTIMLVTHDMGFVNSLVGRVFCINGDFQEHPLENADTAGCAPHLKGMQVVRHDINLFGNNFARNDEHSHNEGAGH